MKRIIKTEECDENFLSDKKRRALIILCEAILIFSASAYTGLTVKEKYDKKINEYEQRIAQLEQRDERVEPLKITQFDLDGRIIQMTDPIIIEERKGVLRNAAPEGFSMMNGVCYRVVYREGIHESFEQIEDERIEDTDGLIPINNKLVEIIKADEEVIGDQKFYSLPYGYVMVGKYGVKVLKIEKSQKFGR